MLLRLHVHMCRLSQSSLLADAISTKSCMLGFVSGPVHDMGLVTRKSSLRGFANNKCADQPAHSRCLIIANVICLL